jgi:hypothetical protein
MGRMNLIDIFLAIVFVLACTVVVYIPIWQVKQNKK